MVNTTEIERVLRFQWFAKMQEQKMADSREWSEKRVKMGIFRVVKVGCRQRVVGVDPKKSCDWKRGEMGVEEWRKWAVMAEIEGFGGVG